MHRIFSIIYFVTIVGSIIFTTTSAHAQTTTQDPKQVLERALGRIFEGHQLLPTGDQRSLKLTPAESALANLAGKKFNTEKYKAGYGYADAPIFQPEFAEQAKVFQDRLKTVIEKYRNKEDLTDEQAKEVADALAPFIRALDIESQIQSGQIVIPPKTKMRFKFTTYCMDKSWPGPQKGEKMQLVPTQTLLPGKLAEIHEALMLRAAQGKVANTDIQGMVWTLRQVANDLKGEKPVSLTSKQKQLLNESLPDGYNVFERVRRPLGRSTLPKELENLVRNEVLSAVGELEKQGHFATRVIEDEQMTQAVEQQLEHINSLPINQPIPNDNSHYTNIAPNIFARAIYGSMINEIANTGNKPFLFSPCTYAGQSQRKVQRMAIQPSPHNQDEDLSKVFADVDWPPKPSWWTELIALGISRETLNGSKIAGDLVKHYNSKEGSPYKLNIVQMAEIQPDLDIRRCNNFASIYTSMHREANRINKVIEKNISISSNEHSQKPNTLGQFKANYQGTLSVFPNGKWNYRGLVDYSDSYDFDSHAGKASNRSTEGSFKTWFGRNLLKGAPFEIESERPSVTQTSDQTSFKLF